ncbi:MAG: ATP-binding protein [Clostridia bacterium]|nr:ATP-binding protein [Clostridia bacterium]
MSALDTYVAAYNEARNSGNISRAVDMGSRAVSIAREELAKDSSYTNRAHLESVIASIGAFLENPDRCKPRPKALKRSEDSEDKISATDWFSAPIPSVKLKDIAGLAEVKDAFIVNIFAPLLPGYSDIYSKYMGKARGIQALLYGPPGTGKTHAVRCLAGELGCKIAVVKISDTLQKYVGEGAKVIETVFEQASKYDKCIIFFDEIDSIASARDGDDSRNTKEQLTTLLTKMDGFTSGVKEGQIRIVIAATNRPWALDSAVKRGGRFDTQIYIPLPDFEARCQLVRLALGKDERVASRVDVPCAPEVSVEALAQRLEGYSGADIKAVCRQAISLPLKREIVSYGAGQHRDDCLTMEDFKVVLSRYINSITDDALMQFEAYRENMEFDIDYIRYKTNDIIIRLYNRYVNKADVAVQWYEITWLKTYWDNGFIESSFGKKYDLRFLPAVFEEYEKKKQ